MASTKIKIGIVGCGAIGSTLARMISKKLSKGFCVAALCDLDSAKAANLAREIKTAKALSLKDLIRQSHLVVEAASAKASFGIACQALSGKKDVLIMSIGGVLGREKELFGLARKNGKKIYFPSGAIAGLDGIRAYSVVGIDRLTLNTYKPPAALRGADYLVKNNIDVDKIFGEKVIFSGTPAEAVRAFPQNINVVALLSLAAGGTVTPQVRIWVSPYLKRNLHVIDAESSAGTLKIRCENVASPDNPKTSALAILSALKTIAGISEVARVGT
ncbi:MAG: aspartate dehydrogenase domain-containing protein [Candidatus Omnitrophota bacterium]